MSVSDVLEHIWHLPELLKVNFQTFGCLLIMTVNANALLSALSIIPKALTIFFLTINFAASTRWELSRFSEVLTYGRLLDNCGLLRLESESVLLFLYIKLGIFQWWFIKHVGKFFGRKDILIFFFFNNLIKAFILLVWVLNMMVLGEKLIH